MPRRSYGYPRLQGPGRWSIPTTPSGPSTQTIDLTGQGIASAEAFGTVQVNLNVSPTGIASSEAFGTVQVNLNVSPTGIASGEAFGFLQANLNVSPTGIASAEAFGVVQITVATLPSSYYARMILDEFDRPVFVILKPPLRPFLNPWQDRRRRWGED